MLLCAQTTKDPFTQSRGSEALSEYAVAGRRGRATSSKQDSSGRKRILQVIIAAVVLSSLTAAGMWVNLHFGEVPLAVGESGGIVSTATGPDGPDASGMIRNVSSDRSKAFAFEADNGRLHAEFSSKKSLDAGVRLSTDRGEAISFSLLGSDNVPRSVSRNVIQFSPEANVQVKYQVLDDRVKEKIVLLSPPKSNVFTFRFSSVGLKKIESVDGYHFYASDGEEVFWLMAPTVDSFGAVPGKSSFEISGNTMRLTVDQDFLDKAFYPVIIDPTVVGTSSSAAATAYSNNRKLLHASDDNLVLFYQRGSDIVYRVSVDNGASWGAETVASASNSTHFSVKMDASDSIYLSYLDDSASSTVRFRKFTYSGSGTWTAGTQWPVEAGGAARAYPDIFVEAGGRIWTVYRLFDGASYTLQARYSDSSLPGWTEDGSAWSAPSEIAPASLESRMYPSFTPYRGAPSIAYLYPSGTNDSILVWRYWSGTDWSSEETVPGVLVDDATYPRFSAASTFDNDVHIVYSTAAGISDVKRDGSSGNWGAPSTVSSDDGDVFPTATTNGGGIRAFWSSYVGPNQRRLAGSYFDGSSWSSPTLLTPSRERPFDRVWTDLQVTPWNDESTGLDALFRFTDGGTSYGNEIGQATEDGYRLDDPMKKSAVKFAAQDPSTVSAIRLYMNSAGTAPTYRIGIQTDATGYPSGNWVNGNAYVDAPNPGGGWNRFDIPDTNVSTATTYHVVVEYVGGVIDASNYASFGYTTPALFSGYDVNTYDGSAWTSAGATPAFVLERSDGSVEGQSIHGSTPFNLTNEALRVGERFTPSSNLTPTSLEMRIARAGTPTGDLTVKVVEGSDTELFSATIATPGSPGSWSWLSVPVSGLTLSSGTTYRVFVYAQGVDSSNYYAVQLATGGGTSPYPELTWGGTTNTAISAEAGSGWTDKTSAAANTSISDVPLFVSDNDTLYVGMTEKFDYAYFDLGVAASTSVNPTWEYWDGTAWQPLALTENPTYDFTVDGNIGFDPPPDWTSLIVNGEGTAKYYVRAQRTADAVATSPIANQITAVRNNVYPTVLEKYSLSIPYAWTEGVSSPYRVKLDSLTAAAPEISEAEARHVDRDTHTSKITWTTNIPATSQIVYDTASHPTAPYSAYPYSTSLDPSLVTSHTVTVSGLTSDTVYYYRILTMNAEGDLTVSDEHLIPPGDLTVDTDTCASCHRSHTAWRPETWTDSTGTKHKGLLIRQP